jgi:hypothetical protein
MHHQNKRLGRAKGRRTISLETGKMTTTEELMISTLTTSDVVAKVLIEKGLITEDEFFQRLWKGRLTYERLLTPDPS